MSLEIAEKALKTPMTSEELGELVAETVYRIVGIGAEQYATPGEPQKFETMPLLDLIEMAREEAQDLIVYAAMIDIRLQRLTAALIEKAGMKSE